MTDLVKAAMRRTGSTTSDSGVKKILTTKGYVNYRLYGDPSPTRPLTVLVHGITAGIYVWERLATELADAGEYVLVYDLFGRGASAAVEEEHTLQLFIQQLSELLHTLGPETQYKSCQPIHLVGQSMGGAVVVGYTEVFPHLVRRLVLMAPAGLPLKEIPFAFLLKVPLFGTIAASLVSAKTFTKDQGMPYHQPELEANQKHMERSKEFMEEQFRINKTYAHGLISTLKHFPLGTMQKSYEAIGHQTVKQEPSATPRPRPTLIIWGDKDPICPFENHKLALQLIPHARLEVMENGSHIDHYVTKYEEMSKAVTDFLGVKQDDLVESMVKQTVSKDQDDILEEDEGEEEEEKKAGHSDSAANAAAEDASLVKKDGETI